MDFFDKLSETANKTYKYTTEKTSKLAKEAKVKMAMNENKGKIEDLYRNIGKKVYERHIARDGVDMDLEALLVDDCTEIDEICDCIEDQRKELLTLKDKKQCPNCFYEIDIDFSYCPNCGDKQEENFEEEQEETQVVEQKDMINQEEMTDD